MKLKNSIPIVAIAVLALIAIPLMGIGNNQSEPMTYDTVKYDSMVCVYVNDGLIDCTKNQLKNEGKNVTRDKFMGGSAAAIDYLAIGNGSTMNSDATQTTMTDEHGAECGLARAQATMYRLATQGNVTYEKQWTSTCNSVVVNNTGLFNASSTGSLFAATDFTDATLNNGDQITVNYTIYVS